jgi:hypothetical protein
MSAHVHQLFAPTRLPLERAKPLGSGRALRAPVPARGPDYSQRWVVDLTALARCRAIFAGHLGAQALDESIRPSQLSTMEVPPAYDAFCRAHFASVRRTNPGLSWDDACPAYAIALSAHAVLCVALDAGVEQRLQHCWPGIRGESTLTWEQARPLIADGCSALNRIDPLAMQR